MREICIPVLVNEMETAEIEVRVSTGAKTDLFKVESFEWETNHAEGDDRIVQLRNSINEYDTSWELIQIFTPAKKSSRIQVLFRKRRDS